MYAASRARATLLVLAETGNPATGTGGGVAVGYETRVLLERLIAHWWTAW